MAAGCLQEGEGAAPSTALTLALWAAHSWSLVLLAFRHSCPLRLAPGAPFEPSAPMILRESEYGQNALDRSCTQHTKWPQMIFGGKLYQLCHLGYAFRKLSRYASTSHARVHTRHRKTNLETSHSCLWYSKRVDWFCWQRRVLDYASWIVVPAVVVLLHIAVYQRCGESTRRPRRVGYTLTKDRIHIEVFVVEVRVERQLIEPV